MDKIAIIDFGGQYAHLIANRVRRLNVYSEVLASDAALEDLAPFAGVIFSGGPSSVYTADAPPFNPQLLQSGKPTLGICYGHHIICVNSGGEVSRGKTHEFGPSTVTIHPHHPLFKDVSAQTKVWMSHGDEISQLPEGFISIGTTKDCAHAAVSHDEKKIYSLQFHPEVTHSVEGMKILDNFLSICDANREWSMSVYFKILEKRLRAQCEGKKVFLLVSGGVDSTVSFALLNQILGPDNVYGLHIDNGMMRHNESADIVAYMKTKGFDNLESYDASDLFLSRLKDVYLPEAKRKIIGDTFIDVLKEQSQTLKIDNTKLLLAQGTTYPDTIESGGTKHSSTIKTHHNRVMAAMDMLDAGILIEPLAELYKDEVRALGETLGVPDELVWRHPFPGPGLGVRFLCLENTDVHITDETKTALNKLLSKHNQTGQAIPISSVGVQGDARTYAHPCLIQQPGPNAPPPNWELCEALSTEITNNIRSLNRVVLEIGRLGSDTYQLVSKQCNRKDLDFLRQADHACTQALFDNALYRDIWQMPVVFLPLTNGGKPVIVMRPVKSAEAMTADFAHMPHKILKDLWETLKGIGAGALWYDITPKPPGTIEWE